MTTNKLNQESYGSRVLGSLKGILFGVVLLLVAAFILFRNEGRTDFSLIADDSIAINAEQIDASLDGELVAARGSLTAASQLGDPSYLLPGDYLRLTRQVEMYAWVEESETLDDETTTYRYVQAWTERPADSSTFEEAATYFNPSLTIAEERFALNEGEIGSFQVDLNNMRLPASRDLQLHEEMLANANHTVVGNHIYVGNSAPDLPQIGDVRLSYEVIPAGLSVTVFGEQQGSRLVPYLQNNDTSLYRAYEGSREAGIAAMRSAYRTTGWMNRLFGFGLMWLGLTLLFGPITALLSFVPMLEKLSTTMMRLVTFGLAFVMSLIIITISMIVHSVVALIVIAMLIGGAIFLSQREKRPQFAN